MAGEGNLRMDVAGDGNALNDLSGRAMDLQENMMAHGGQEAS